MITYKRILVPIDFSTLSMEAIDVAKSIARSGTEIHLVHVYEPQMVYAHAGGTIPPDSTEVGPTKQQKMDDLAGVCEKVELGDAKYAVVDGSASVAIVDYAMKNDIDLIVMTTHGEKGVMRLLMGSVAEHVVRKSPCPVLTLKSKSAHSDS